MNQKYTIQNLFTGFFFFFAITVIQVSILLKVVEQAALSLSDFALGAQGSPWISEIIASLESVSKNKSEEIHFTVGESLSIIGYGWLSSCSLNPYLDLETDQKAQNSDCFSNEVLEQIMKKVIKKHISHPASRPGASIWLLSLVKYAGNHEYIQKNLQTIQMIFSSLLSDNSGKYNSWISVIFLKKKTSFFCKTNLQKLCKK